MSEHGGDIYTNKVEIDFSVNTSPYGMPPMVRAALGKSMLYTGVYPDPEYKELRQAIGEMEQVSPDEILCGNGASELIYAVARAICGLRRDGVKAGLLVPCFSEYKKALEAAGVTAVREVPLSQDKDFIPTKEDINRCMEEAGLIFLGNPNNPSGKLLPTERLEQISQKASKSGTYVVLDESFLPLTCSNEKWTSDREEIVRIKSFTKSMAMPGIRLGYCICKDEALRNEIKKQLPEWNVSMPACCAGIAAARAGAWLTEQLQDTETGLAVLREDLANRLKERGIEVYSSDTCFLLLKTQENLYEKLLERKILIRKCDNFNSLDGNYYRVAVKKKEECDRLIQALDDSLKELCPVQKDVPALMQVKPGEIEKKSFEIITSELMAMGIVLSDTKAAVIKRCIHTTADFEYAHTLFFSENAIPIMKELIRGGAHIVTDTNMALSGINKSELAKYGGEVHCFMADEEIAKRAKEKGCTRATMSMEHAATLKEKLIFVVGNAPTALVTLAEMMDRKAFMPEFIVGVPVGFVNVEPAKEMIMQRNVSYIINRGRKGGSNVAAAIVNAILYEMRNEANE